MAASEEAGNPLLEASRPRGERTDRVWKRYRNPNLGYCVSYPARWARGDAFDGSGLIVETGLSRWSKPVGEIDIGPIDTPTSEDARIKPASFGTDALDENLREHLAGLQKFERAEKVRTLSQQHLTMKGVAALYAKNQYYDPLERSNWLEEVVFIERNGTLFRLELQCPPSQINRFEPVFAYLVNTFDLDCK